MDAAQINHMVSRFLAWKLPDNFTPDAGITFKREFNENTPHPMKHAPLGTNLFDGQQASEMVRHMIAGLPEDQALKRQRDAECERANRLAAFIRERGLGREYGEFEDRAHAAQEALPAGSPLAPQTGFAKQQAAFPYG